MVPIFLDTSFAIALAVADDMHHMDALELREYVKREQIQLLTTSAVLLEIGDGLSRIRYRTLAFTILEFFRRDPTIEIAQLSDVLLEKAIDLYRNRPDKEWGLTDCVSFVVMQERGITDALTTDDHFQQAGFRALLRRK